MHSNKVLVNNGAFVKAKHSILWPCFWGCASLLLISCDYNAYHSNSMQGKLATHVHVIDCRTSLLVFSVVPVCIFVHAK